MYEILNFYKKVILIFSHLVGSLECRDEPWRSLGRSSRREPDHLRCGAARHLDDVHLLVVPVVVIIVVHRLGVGDEVDLGEHGFLGILFFIETLDQLGDVGTLARNLGVLKSNVL